MIAIEIKRQFFAAISANLIVFSFGWSIGWANANLIHLTSSKEAFDSGPITDDEAAIFMSIICAGGLFGNILYLWVLEKFGRKNSILFLSIPTILSWILIIYAKNAFWLYASRLICGFVGGAIFVSTPVFIAEICSDSVRGVVNALGFSLNSLGTLVGLIAAIYLDFRAQAIWALSVPLLFIFIFYFVPESPEFLYNKNKTELADISQKYYKGMDQSTESEKIMTENQYEEQDKRLINDQHLNLDKENNTTEMYSNLVSKMQKNNIAKNCEENAPEALNKPLSISDFVATRAARKAVYISLFLVILPQFCGCYILLSYSVAFFADAGSSLTPIQSSIMICLVQLIANLSMMFLIDRIGRKILFITSSFATGLGMLVLSVHHLYKIQLPNTNWVPIYGLSFTIFIASIGLLPVPFIITIDVLPPKIRHATMTISSMIMWTLGFSTNIAYINMLRTINLHGCLLVFSLGCICCALYALIFIPETKGKSNESVTRLLEKQRFFVKCFSK